MEFIICNRKTIFWKRSFEIGAQRLLDHFFKHDPIPGMKLPPKKRFYTTNWRTSVRSHTCVSAEDVNRFSGTFDTLCDIEALKRGLDR